MKLEDQVVSLPLAKKLKELGVKQESMFYWVDMYYHQPFQDDVKGLKSEVVYGLRSENEFSHKEEIASAYTVAELGEMLPDCIKFKGQMLFLYMDVDSGDNVWFLHYLPLGASSRGSDDWIGYPMISNDHGRGEADARAKMVIYLKENKLI